jgi:hypothetical protein
MKGINMHTLLADIFEANPGETVYLSLGDSPQIVFKSMASGVHALITPETMAEIINSLITDEEGAEFKWKHQIRTQLTDEVYQRNILVQSAPRSVSIEITSRPLTDIEAENKKLIDTLTTLELIKG